MEAAVADRPLRIAIVAGEASGDAQGAALLRAVADLAPERQIDAWGVGSRLLTQAGVRVIRDCAPYSSIGVAAALTGIPVMLATLADMKRMIAQTPPDVLVFNVPLARFVKERALCPVFYYFPPGSWRKTRRAGRRSLGSVTDLIVTPFPWSADILRAEGANVRFVGHPLLDLVKPTLAAGEFFVRFGLDDKKPLIALLPGSRPAEIRANLPAMIGAAGEITKRLPTAQFAIALAATVTQDLVEEIVRQEQRAGRVASPPQLKIAPIAPSQLTPGPRLATNEGLTVPAMPPDETLVPRAKVPAHAPVVICEGMTYDVLARSDFVITKSGTSTLEAAILKKPMVVIYRGNSLMELEWKLRKRSLNIPFMALPNILAGEAICPELIQDDATPQTISAAALEILLDSERLMRTKDRLGRLVQDSLGETGGVRRAAELLLELVAERESHAAPAKSSLPS
jgi:lipid-A-disaccharide synthase